MLKYEKITFYDKLAFQKPIRIEPDITSNFIKINYLDNYLQQKVKFHRYRYRVLPTPHINFIIVTKEQMTFNELFVDVQIAYN